MPALCGSRAETATSPTFPTLTSSVIKRPSGSLICRLHLLSSLFHFKFSMGFPDSGSKAEISFSLFTSERERRIKKRMRKTKFYFSEWSHVYTHGSVDAQEAQFFCLCNNNPWGAGTIALSKVAEPTPLCKMQVSASMFLSPETIVCSEQRPLCPRC